MVKQNRMSSVYAIRCSKNGKVYIGCTMDLEMRIQAHLYALRTKKKRDIAPHWQADYDLYGEEAFSVYVMESGVAWADRRKRESYWIAEYNATDPRYGYNKDKAAPAPKIHAGDGPAAKDGGSI